MYSGNPDIAFSHPCRPTLLKTSVIGSHCLDCKACEQLRRDECEKKSLFVLSGEKTNTLQVTAFLSSSQTTSSKEHGGATSSTLFGTNQNDVRQN